MTIGVLAFQGDVIEHLHALGILGVQSCEVRSVEQLAHVNALIIPGGESTVMAKFLSETGLADVITDRHRREQFPIFGTCAGAILLAREAMHKEEISDEKCSVAPRHGVELQSARGLDLMDIAVERNAYGKQAESFEADITVSFPEGDQTVHGLFIRAPKIISVGKGVEVLGRHESVPVVCKQGNLLVATFHPELLKTPSSLHRYFLSLCRTKIDILC